MSEALTRKQLIKMIENEDDVRNVDTSQITDMSYLFCNAEHFNRNRQFPRPYHHRNEYGMISPQEESSWHVAQKSGIGLYHHGKKAV